MQETMYRLGLRKVAGYKIMTCPITIKSPPNKNIKAHLPTRHIRTLCCCSQSRPSGCYKAKPPTSQPIQPRQQNFTFKLNGKSEVAGTASAEMAPVASRPSSAKNKKNKKKKNKPGKYSVLVLDAVKKLNERSGSSLVKIYNEAKKESWFDEQNGRTYLRYSIRALVLNNTLIQVKGMGANGSFRLNKDKFAKDLPKKTPSKPAKTTTKTAKALTTKKATVVKPKAKSSPKKAPVAKKPAAKLKNLGAKKVSAAQKNKKPKKASKPPAKSPRKK